MLNAILFDLDGTLLPLDQAEFTKRYMEKLGAFFAALGYEPEALCAGVWRATGAMVENDGARPNEAVFWTRFAAETPGDPETLRAQFDRFYDTAFKELRAITGFNPALGALVKGLRARGLKTVLASNPLFPMAVQQLRMRWAGLDPADFDLVTAYENSSFCKPNIAYYRAIADKLGLDPETCLMVGNDAREDMAAAALGMRVFLVTDRLHNPEGLDIAAFPHGSWVDCAMYIEQLRQK